MMLAPDWAKGHLRAAVAYEGLQEWTISAEKYREAKKLVQDSSEARSQFGMMNTWERKISERCSDGTKLCYEKIAYEACPYIMTDEYGNEVFEEQGDCFIGYQVHYHKNGPRPRLWIQWEYYRWSQTSTNMTVIIFDCKPEELVVREIDIKFKKQFLSVRQKKTGKVWFERELKDLIMPEECTWTLEDGNIVIQMYKNVAKVIHDARGNGHFHDRLYWKALFAGQHEMRGHEMDHDFSDLPEGIVHKEKQRQKDDSAKQREQRERERKLTPAEKKVEDDARQERLMNSIQEKNDEIMRKEAMESGKLDASLFDPNPFD